MATKDLIIKKELDKIRKTTKECIGLECEHILSEDAVLYAEDIIKILEEKICCVFLFTNEKKEHVLRISWYCD